MIQIATLMVYKFENDIIVEEHDVESIDLGPPTTKKALGDMNDLVKIVHDMLRMEVEKNKKLEREVDPWRNYFHQFKELSHVKFILFKYSIRIKGKS